MKVARNITSLPIGIALLTACATPPHTPPESTGPACVEGETLAEGLNMRAGPSTQDSIIVTLPRGTPIRLAGCTMEASQQGRWVEIIIGPRGEEITGWISVNPRFVELREPE